MNTHFDDLFSAFLSQKLMERASIEIQRYLTESNSKPERVLPWQNPNELRQTVERLMHQIQEKGSIEEGFSEVARQYLEASIHLHSPHNIGHQVGVPLSISAAFESVSAISNQASGVYEMGLFNAAAEKVMIAELGKKVGWGDQNFDGIVTHGGSLANFTGLLAARNARYPDFWTKGAPNGVRPAIVTSAESHYSNSRAAGMMGIGVDSVLSVPVDEKRRMDTVELVDVLDQAESDGLDVFCIMASSCATPIGAFDDLEAIGKIAQERGIWLHVDGAHGASLLLSKKYRQRLRGVEYADSISWDAHKMMCVQSLCTFLFYRNKATSYGAFTQKAPYLFSSNETLDYDGALRTFECTKGAVVMPFFASWCVLGATVFEELIDGVIQRTEEFYELLKITNDFDVIHAPECNILCFRYVPAQLKRKSLETISEFQRGIRELLIKSGKFYITTTVLDQVSALRVTVMNPLTDQTHFQLLLNTIREIGAELI